MNNNNYFGCLEETPSVRTYTYGAVYGGTSDIEVPESYLLPEERLPQITAQGSTSACVAFSLAEILSIFNYNEFGEQEQFSEGFIYGYNREPSTYRGMFPQHTLDYMLKTGSVPKKYYNLLCEMPDMRLAIMNDPNIDKLVEIAEKYRIGGYVGFLNNEIEEVKQALFTSQTPILACSDSYFGNRHAIIIIGWEKDGWIIQNSWGEKWGNGGRARVPYSAIQEKYLVTDEVFELKFVDVDKEKWYYDAIKETVFNGLMQGTSKDTFEPDRPITRGEMAQLCVNLCKKVDEILALTNKEKK